MVYVHRMVSGRWFLLLAGCLWPSVIWAADDIAELILPNGLKVLVKPDRRSPIVVFQLWYKVGSGNEQPGYTGISHLLEHLMHRGKKAPSLAPVYRQMASIGAQSNAYTSRDHTYYYHSLGKAHLSLVFALEAERMQRLSVDSHDFNIEKQVIREEVNDRLSRDPYLPATNALYQLAFPDDGYQVPVIGQMRDQDALTLPGVLKWYNNYYTPDNATIVVVGDIEPEQVFALAWRYFAAIDKPGRAAAHHFPANDKLPVARRRIMPDSTGVGMVLLAFRVPSIKTSKPDWEGYALEVLAGWFDSGIHSRLTRALIRDRHLAHELFVDYAPMNRRQSLLIIEAKPAQGISVAQLERAINKELEKIRREPLDRHTLQKVINQMISTEIFERDSMYIQAKIIGQAESVDIPWWRDAQYIARIKAVTAAQVNTVLLRYLRPEQQFVVIQNTSSETKQ